MQRRVTMGALALFVLLDVVLVILAVRHTSAPGTTVSVAGHGSGQATSPKGAASSTPTTGASTAGDPGSVAFLAVAKDGTVVRSSRGQCPGDTSPTVEVSQDTGRTFAGRPVPALREVLSVQVSSAQKVQILGLDAACRLKTYATGDGGRNWFASSGATGWHLAANADAKKVVSPDGTRATPCTPTWVTTAPNGVVRVLCQNGTILGSDDLGLTWVSLGRLAGAVAIQYSSSGAGLALARQPGCAAAVLQTIDGGNTWSRATCLPGSDPLALGAAGDLTLAQVGDRLFVSTAGGSGWRPSGA